VSEVQKLLRINSFNFLELNDLEQNFKDIYFGKSVVHDRVVLFFKTCGKNVSFQYWTGK